MAREYQICTQCVMDTTDTDICFNAEGVCSWCSGYPKRAEKTWLRGERGKRALEQLINQVQQAGKGCSYDCVVGLSGGVDSTWLALKAKDWGLRPLAFHVDAGWNSELAVQNIECIVNFCKFDLKTDILDWEEVRDVQVAFLKSGVMNQDVPQDHAFFASLFTTTRSIKVPWVLVGSNMSTECVLAPSFVGYSNPQDAKNLKAIHRKFGTAPLETFPSLGVFKTLLYRNGFFMKIGAPLNMMEYNKPAALEELKTRAGFKPYPGKHGESVFTKFYQDYWLPNRYGIDKRKCHLSSLIITGQLSREKAMEELSRPALTPQEEEFVIDYVCKKLRLNRAEFQQCLSAPKREHNDYPNAARMERLTAKYLMWPVRKLRRMKEK